MNDGLHDAHTPAERLPGTPRLRDKPWFQHTATSAILLALGAFGWFLVIPGLGMIAHGVWNQILRGWGAL